MPPEITKEIGRLLMSYSGPEPERVRTAIAKLANDDLRMIENYLALAKHDYGHILSQAEIKEEDERNSNSLSGMTVNERLFHLKLFPEWDAAVARKDRKSATAILLRCELSSSNIDNIINAEFKSA
jgi:hypothetical protein